MAKCYFECDIKRGYPCEYEVVDEKIIIKVDYDIGDEIEEINGVRAWPASPTFKQRDLLVVDGNEKKSLLIKNASYSGMNSRFGSLDDISITSFMAYEWFESADLQRLLQLYDESLKVKSIKIYSETISEYYKHPRVTMNKKADELNIHLSKEKKTESVSINHNNIDCLLMGDDWNCVSKLSSMAIEMDGYIEILLKTEVDYTEVYKYIYELMIFMQLYYPAKFKVSKVKLNISDNEYRFVTKVLKSIQYTDKNINYSVKEKMLLFLKRCYTKIPYRDIQGDVRNIPYVIMNSYRNIEDNFLMFYRFIEFRYKRKKHYDEQEDYVKEAIYEHYKCGDLCEDWVQAQSKEIVCLRNHYAHEGYYIHNSVLKINYKRRADCNYEVIADFEWLYKKTKILYLMVIDIIFTEMLGFQEYDFQKRF